MKISGSLILVLSLVLLRETSGLCASPTPLTLQFILEYAEWRLWTQVVLFDKLNGPSCMDEYIRPMISCFSKRGIKVTVRPSDKPLTHEEMRIAQHRLGAVILVDSLNMSVADNVLFSASHKSLYNYYVSWLLITRNTSDSIIDSYLRYLNIGIDSDVVVATSSVDAVNAAGIARRFENRTCKNLRPHADRYDYASFETAIEERPQVRTNLELSDVDENSQWSFQAVSVYKIRTSDNTSLVVRPLGGWNPDGHSMTPPERTKERDDFRGFPIVVGVQNGSNVDEEQVNDVAPLIEFISLVAGSLNSSAQLKYHEKLGTLANKAWSDLLGDVVTGNVDIGLGYITINDDRRLDMFFTQPLLTFTRNIYHHATDSGAMRDIFLQPFNNKLLFCVALTYFIIIFAMGLINYIAKTALADPDNTNNSLSDTTLYVISIMCMQGTPYTPTHPSGKIVLVASLMFGLVTYNAYAGFITSILSVKTSSIDTLNDLLQEKIRVGFTATDDEYLRSWNDSDIRKFYIKALSSTYDKLDTRTGLENVVQGDYAVFMSSILARRALQNSVIQDRCKVEELVLKQTAEEVALPMAKSSPYKKIINLSILRIKERGVLDKIKQSILPDMPYCEKSSTFHMAQFADVYSAFVILGIGVATAVSMGILEKMWHARIEMRERLLSCAKRCKENACDCDDYITTSTDDDEDHPHHHHHHHEHSYARALMHVLRGHHHHHNHQHHQHHRRHQHRHRQHHRHHTDDRRQYRRESTGIGAGTSTGTGTGTSTFRHGRQYQQGTTGTGPSRHRRHYRRDPRDKDRDRDLNPDPGPMKRAHSSQPAHVYPFQY